ncbi:hypothetical protein B0F90DRAFT_1342791 [Multifurca ochricompacta]|uniref:Uncharacterized protein n=1 Tax=Multifurca ochricompacta TaxID=376703 RepID=A0AAD4LZH4_9AGAM|nr:hypothetical protein B0F90DRAFT_1342791 [Multifurca ochricompacta]
MGLAHRATHDSATVLRSRILFSEALDDRIRELSQLRERFVNSRQIFREKPVKLLAGSIRDARGHAHEGMFSHLRPLFDQIDKYYGEVNVSLLAEAQCLERISRSLHVTPDDKLRWEHIRDACREASTLFMAPQSSPSIPYTAPRTNNKTAFNMQALAQSVTVARQRLQQTYSNVTMLTHHPQLDLLRLKGEYEKSEKTCRQRIGEVLELSERFLHSFVEVPAVDDFREHLSPTAATSSSRTLQEVAAEVRSASTMSVIQGALPYPADHFVRFELCLPNADASMQRMYRTLRGLVQPLEQPDDPKRGVSER